MRLLGFVCVMIFTSVMGFAQVSDYYTFSGVLSINAVQSIPFKLKFKKPQGVNFKGYSLTNAGKEDQTKSIVKGALDLKQNTLSFHEIGNMETKSSAEDSLFCYIHATDLQISTKGENNLVTGEFVGLFPSGKKCASGKVYLVSQDDLQEPEAPVIVQQKEDLPTHNGLQEMLVEKDTVVSDSSLPSSDVNVVVFTSNEELEIKEWGNSILLQVWDGDLLDHDEIAIYVDGELFKDEIVLERNKTSINIPGSDSGFTLKIVALNEGGTGLNTLSFRFKDINDNKQYVSELKTSESFTISFKR